MKPKQIKQTQVKRFRWPLVAAALLLLLGMTAWAWSLYQTALRNQANFKPTNDQTIKTLQNATDNFSIGR